jgi:pleiotropic regulator 1
VIRSYHGHLSGVYSLSLHPTLDLLVTGGRDSVARVWDMRTKQQVFVLSGHQATVAGVACQEAVSSRTSRTSRSSGGVV